MLLVTYRPMPEHEFSRSGIVERVKAILAEESGPEEMYLVGSPSLRVAATGMMSRDMTRFTPASALVLSAVLFACFRSVRGVVVPLATVGLGVVWTVGLMGYLGVPLDLVGLLLPSLLLAVGSAYSTHIVAQYYDEAAGCSDRREIVARILGHVGPPVVVTALATLFGFAALAAYRIPAIRSFGAFATFGIAVTFLLTLSFTPALLAVLPLPRRRAATVDREWAWLRRAMDRLVSFDERRRRPLLAVSVALMLGLALGIPRLEFETDVVSYFPHDSAERRAVAAATEHLGSNINFLVAVEPSEPRALTRLDDLVRLEALQAFVASVPGVTATASIVDVVKLANRALAGGNSGTLVLPDSDEAAAQLLLLVPPEVTEPFLLPDGSRAVIRVRSALQKSTELRDALARIEAHAAASFPASFTVRTTGMIPLVNRTADELASGQVVSLLVALAVIFVTMATYFVSFRLGLVAMLPNLVPVVLYFGFLGWAGIPLSLSTALIGSIALGLGVDEAIHLLTEFRRRLRSHGDQRRAMAEAMSTTGPPVVFATLALTLGSLTQVISGFVPIRQFGAFSALNIVASLLADLFLLPALVSSLRLVTISDLVSRSLGQAIAPTIPLFAGLGRIQTRIAISMGRLRSVHAGERFVTAGETSDAMFVLLSGQAEVRSGARRDTVLGVVARGAVVGEMGILRKQARSADVVALTPVEALELDARFFDVLRRRHPRIAAAILKNLACALSDRLQTMSERMLAEVAENPVRRAG
jgi:hypothetical protein